MYPSGSKIEQVCCGPFRTLRVSQDQGFTACVEFTWATALPLWAVYVCVCVCVCWWGGRDQQVQLEHEAHAACYDVIDMMCLSSRSLMFSGIYETVAG